jgi:hypothetical protein
MYGRGDDDDGGGGGLAGVLRQLEVTHVLCTPALWSTVETDGRGGAHHPHDDFPSLRVVALGGEPIPRAMAGRWARKRGTTTGGGGGGGGSRVPPPLRNLRHDRGLRVSDFRGDRGGRGSRGSGK